MYNAEAKHTGDICTIDFCSYINVEEPKRWKLSIKLK